GAVYIWSSREAAERGHDAAWRSAVEQRTGAPPVIRYFDLFMLIDNSDGAVVEFPPNAPWRR
ncbi:MAG: monooxygenase, partial [Rhodoblastus sp.]|nr:monooxygenase [Rhodoblastus sp.]